MACTNYFFYLNVAIYIAYNPLCASVQRPKEHIHIIIWLQYSIFVWKVSCYQTVCKQLKARSDKYIFDKIFQAICCHKFTASLVRWEKNAPSSKKKHSIYTYPIYIWNMTIVIHILLFYNKMSYISKSVTHMLWLIKIWYSLLTMTASTWQQYRIHFVVAIGDINCRLVNEILLLMQFQQLVAKKRTRLTLP